MKDWRFFPNPPNAQQGKAFSVPTPRTTRQSRLREGLAASDGCDGIFHTAALHGIHSQNHTPSEFFETNATGTFNVLEAARRAQVRRVVVSSTTGAFGSGPVPQRPGMPARITPDVKREPRDIYGFTKYLCEDMCAFQRTRGVEAVALRYGGIRQLVNSATGRVGIWWAASGVMTDVRDAVRANIAAMTMEPLGGRVAHTVLPTTLVDEDAIERHGGFIPALTAAAPFLAGLDLSDLTARPVLLYDAATVQRELGVPVAHGQTEFLREAAGLEPPARAEPA